MRIERLIIWTSLALFIIATVLSTVGGKFDLYAGILLIAAGFIALLGRKPVMKDLEVAGKYFPKASFLFSSSTVWYWGIATIVLGIVQIGVSAN